MNRLGTLTLVIGFFVLAGCALGPDYRPPETRQPDEWAEKRRDRLNLDTGPVTRWWRVFDDQQLTELIDRVARENLRLQTARTRVRVARALREASEGGYYPSVAGDAFYGRTRSSENDPRGIADLARLGFADLETDLFEGSFDATWEVDVFGRIQRQVESAQANLEAIDASRRDLLISVLAETARNYVELRGFQGRRRWLNHTIEAQKELISFLDSQYRHGLVSEQDVLRAESTLSDLRSRRPGLQSGIQSRIHRLSVLAGTRPRVLEREFTSFRSLQVPEEPVPVGLRSEILRRRPDVRRAERRLAEATAEIGVAKANLFPRFFLTGSAGRTSSSFSDVFESASRTWSYGPSAQWSVLQGGRLRAELKAAKGSRKVALRQYRQTVLRVLEDVESSLVNYGQSMQALDHKRNEVRTREATYRRTKTNEELGLASEVSRLRDRIGWTRARRAMIRQRTDVQMNLVRLYKALGGGWKAFDAGENESSENVSKAGSK